MVLSRLHHRGKVGLNRLINRGFNNFDILGGVCGTIVKFPGENLAVAVAGSPFCVAVLIGFHRVAHAILTARILAKGSFLPKLTGIVHERHKTVSFYVMGHGQTRKFRQGRINIDKFKKCIGAVSFWKIRGTDVWEIRSPTHLHIIYATLGLSVRAEWFLTRGEASCSIVEC